MNRLIAFFCAALVALLPVESFAQQVSGPTTTAVTQAAGNSSSKIANTAFVGTAINNAIAGINPAVAVQAATTAAGNTSAYTYNNGASGIGATLTGVANTALTVDGYTFTAVGQRLLVKNDTQSPSGAFNGVYSVTQIQTGILPLILTRALDYDMPSDINNTGAIPVQNGTVNGSTSYVITSQVTTVGTDPLTFTQFSLNPTTVVVGPSSATDGHLAVFDGTSGKLIKDGGGNPGLFNQVMSATPTTTITGLSNFLGTGAASANISVGVRVSGTSGGMGAYTTSVPGTPYSITALMAGGVIGWTDGTKIQFIYAAVTGPNNVIVQSDTNITTFSATNATVTSAVGNFNLTWLRIRDDGTNVTFSYSNDGVSFSTAFTVSKASGFLGASGYTHIFAGSPGGSGAQGITIMSWSQGT